MVAGLLTKRSHFLFGVRYQLLVIRESYMLILNKHMRILAPLLMQENPRGSLNDHCTLLNVTCLIQVDTSPFLRSQDNAAWSLRLEHGVFLRVKG